MLSIEEMISEAKKARELSYSPYSKFAVGAVIECKDGTLIYRANIENAAYGLCMCAERNAVFQGYLKGYRQKDYLQICIIADSEGITSPCGSCRQVLNELFSHEARIICSNMDGEYLVTNIDELLPYSFSKGNMR